jgi:hypothetical protein
MLVHVLVHATLVLLSKFNFRFWVQPYRDKEGNAFRMARSLRLLSERPDGNPIPAPGSGYDPASAHDGDGAL